MVKQAKVEQVLPSLNLNNVRGEVRMDQFWENEYIQIAADYSVVILCMVVFLAIFEGVTKYKNWEEIKKGNVAVAMATGGKIFGIVKYFSFFHRTASFFTFNDWLGNIWIFPFINWIFYL